MRATLAKIYQDVSGSYWFLPALMAVLAAVLSVVSVYADLRFASAWLNQFPAFNVNQTAGARSVLSAIAGSMITVAGVTFSMTIVAVSFASAQYGPRLVGNFMRDKGNQLTLGTFIATFVYSLLTLRAVRVGDDVASSFVPHLSVVVAVGLALISVGVLIYFIHHVPETINVGKLTAHVGRRLKRDIRRCLEDGDNAPAHDVELDDEWQRRFGEESLAVASDRDGYVQAISERALVEVAAENDLVVRLVADPGRFVAEGETLVLAWPKERVTDEARDRLDRCFAFGSQRTADQDPLFLVDQLVEIMARALSPGVNDPFTAFGCIDWLRVALRELLVRDPAPTVRFGPGQEPRLFLPATSFRQVAEHVFDQSIQYVAADRNAALYLMQTLEKLRSAARAIPDLDLLNRYADQLAAAGAALLPAVADRELLAERHRMGKVVLAASPGGS